MNQPPLLPHVERVRLINSEIEHLLGLLDGDDVGDHAHGTISLLDLIASLEVACADPVFMQVFMPLELGLGARRLRTAGGSTSVAPQAARAAHIARRL